MSSTPDPLLEPRLFMELSNLVATRGIKTLVETGTGPRSSGMEAAKRLGLMGYTCDVYEPCVMRANDIYPDFHIYHAESLQFLRDCLPQITGPTFFWLDGHCPTDHACKPGEIFPLYEELTLIRAFKQGFENDVLWLDDIAMITAPDNPMATAWDVDLAGKKWHGDDSHSWEEYLAVFRDSHDAVIDREECLLKLTPK